MWAQVEPNPKVRFLIGVDAALTLALSPSLRKSLLNHLHTGFYFLKLKRLNVAKSNMAEDKALCLMKYYLKKRLKSGKETSGKTKVHNALFIM